MKKICLTLICLFTTLSAWAAFAVNAQVDKTNLTLDDELTLTIQITGANGRVDTPQLPSLPSFNVYSREMNQSSINGNTTLIYRYTMLPRLVGNATIGAISVNYQGKTYQTEPIEIHIYRDGSPARPANPATTQAAATGQNTSNYDSSLSTATVEQADPSLPLLERTLANQAYNRGQQETFFLISAVSNNNPYVNEPLRASLPRQCPLPKAVCYQFIYGRNGLVRRVPKNKRTLFPLYGATLPTGGGRRRTSHYRPG